MEQEPWDRTGRAGTGREGSLLSLTVTETAAAKLNKPSTPRPQEMGASWGGGDLWSGLSPPLIPAGPARIPTRAE